MFGPALMMVVKEINDKVRRFQINVKGRETHSKFLNYTEFTYKECDYCRITHQINHN